ncbi:hypothetical protein GCM10023191_063230 [Actinoallomurus oryzae]|uniref:Uncharacterized protein n=1 Tax=Actinoallomurus oryzae TaxID=502180 RepID=A0ABP8QMP2_9ACTN
MDPYTVVNMVMQELARRGVKSHYGPEINLREAAEHAAAMLDAMGAPVVEI